MSETKHTPGPWHVTKLQRKGWNYLHGEIVSHLGRIAGGDDEGDANARLIAAAPDLLATLKLSLDWLASYPGGNAMHVYESARAAIAKAEGR